MSLKAPIPKPHTKACKVCKTKFEVSTYLPFAVVCSVECSLEYAKQQQAKSDEKKRLKAVREKREFKQNDKALLLRTAQAVFNTYIRTRDKDKPCISCGYSGDKRQWHASHYKPMGNNPAIRFDEFNVHKSCSICNNHLSGNLVPYRDALITKIGLEKVEWLESQKQNYKWTIDELKNIIQTYKQKIKDMV